jgi:hypothetical protein
VPEVIRLLINHKEYVFKLDDSKVAEEWCRFINKSAKDKDVKISKVRGKTWRTPHISMERFLKEANTFDLLKFKDNGETTYGIILQTIDKDAAKELLYERSPEVFYYNHKAKKLSIFPADEMFSGEDMYVIPLVNYECDEETLEESQKFIKREVC